MGRLIGLTECPDEETLQEYTNGELFDATGADSISKHLEYCEECRQYIENEKAEVNI